MNSPILDVACGSRMFWFDKADHRALFADLRRESHVLPDRSSKGGSRVLMVEPDIQVDFTALPFADERFSLVVFDPPHLVRAGRKSWLAKKYGKLGGHWSEDLRLGFAECFRVLKPEGTLIFKWNETQISLSSILALTPAKPLFGSKGGRAFKSHWVVFMKSVELAETPAGLSSVREVRVISSSQIQISLFSRL
jgi:SAM-dependent methyltransferase